MRERLFGNWGAGLDDTSFARALLVLGVAACSPDRWRQLLEIPPRLGVLSWGAAEAPEAWGRLVSPAEAVALGAAYVEKMGEHGTRIRVVGKCAHFLPEAAFWINSQLSSVGAVWFEIDTSSCVSLPPITNDGYIRIYLQECSENIKICINNAFKHAGVSYKSVRRNYNGVVDIAFFDKINPFVRKPLSRIVHISSACEADFAIVNDVVLNDGVAYVLDQSASSHGSILACVRQAVQSNKLNRYEGYSDKFFLDLSGVLRKTDGLLLLPCGIGYLRAAASEPVAVPRDISSRAMRPRRRTASFLKRGEAPVADFSFTSIRFVAPPSSPRYLRSRIDALSPDGTHRPAAYFQPETVHSVAVWIAPLAAEERPTGPAFPEDQLEPGPLGSELTVVLTEPHQLPGPLVGAVLLPRDGASNECLLTLPPLKPGRFQGRITIIHRNRVIQTATLSGTVDFPGGEGGEPIRFEVDAVVRGTLADLDARSSFDAAILVADDGEGMATRTVVRGDRVYIREMDDVVDPARSIQGALDAATRQEAPSVANLLFLCAHQGILLRDAILDGALAAPLKDARAIQLVSAKPESYLPLEFCYDGQPPGDEAQVCPKVSATCRSDCSSTGTVEVICPMAFWGLSRVIERQGFDPAVDRESGWVVRREPDGARKAFGHLCAAVVGTSDRADKHGGVVKVADVDAALCDHGLHLLKADTWSKWREQIKSLPADAGDAALLLLIGHTDMDERSNVAVLEIGGDKLRLSAVGEDHVGKANALVILLGCNTVGGGGEVNRFATRFRRQGAEVVVATTAAVLGLHALPLAKALVEGLAEAGRVGGGTSLGELVRALRLRFLIEGIPIGLAVVAFGDADWTLDVK